MTVTATIDQGKLLRGIARDLFEIIESHPEGLTVGEIYRLYKGKFPTTQRSRNELAKRVTDLKNWGAVMVSGYGPCPVTGRSAYLWVITGKLPKRINPAAGESAHASAVKVLLQTGQDMVADEIREFLAAEEAAKEFIEDLPPETEKPYTVPAETLEGLAMASALSRKREAARLMVDSVNSGEMHITTLLAMRRSCLERSYSLWTWPSTRKRLRKEAEALEYTIRSLQFAREYL